MLNKIRLILGLLFEKTDFGNITISSNCNEIYMDTGWAPRHVFISFENDCGNHTCGSHHDWFDIKKTKRGFIIKYNIQSSFRKIIWVATR